MFILGDPYDETKECFALRPMTCPFQYQVYLNRQRSYRDLPMRLGETSTLFRNEDSGEMHGLIRVRQFTISEGHLVLRPDQLEDEFRDCLDLAKYCLGTVGLLDKCTFRFSQWDPANPKNKYEGTKEQWDHAQSVMAKILDDLGVKYDIGIDEAAFYGPKLDIQYKNVYGKEDTLVTIQIDMLLAERFGMYYTDENGEKKLPYIIHRTSLGCYERTLAYLIEHYAGALPTWMAPEQVRFLPVTDRAVDYCKEQAAKLTAQGYRVTVDTRSEKIGKKIRDAQMEKIPYMLVVGDRDIEAGTVSPRHRADGDLGAMTLDAFTAVLKALWTTSCRSKSPKTQARPPECRRAGFCGQSFRFLQIRFLAALLRRDQKLSGPAVIGGLDRLDRLFGRLDHLRVERFVVHLSSSFLNNIPGTPVLPLYYTYISM